MKALKLVILAAVLIGLFMGCGKNPLLSALPEAASTSGSGTTTGGGGNVLISESFDTLNTGPFVDGTNGWSVITGGTSSATIDAAIYNSSQRSLKINKVGLTMVSLKKGISSPSSVIYLEYYIYTTTVSNWGFRIGLSVNGVSAVNIEIIDGYFNLGYITHAETAYTSYAGVKTDVAASTNTWYKIKLKMDISSKTWEIWINDQSPVIGFTGPFNTDGSLTGFVDGFVVDDIFMSPDNTTYIDDIKVYR